MRSDSSLAIAMRLGLANVWYCAIRLSSPEEESWCWMLLLRSRRTSRFLACQYSCRLEILRSAVAYSQ